MSLNGSFFDMETFCSVKGRNPQYSAMQWYRSNYFGFEYLGQLNVLRGLCKNQLINYNSVEYIDIKYEFNAGFTQSILDGFIKMMGFNSPNIPIYLQKKLQPLVNSFLYLSRKFYFKKEWLRTSNPNSLSSCVYDFSRFFRNYPLIKSNIYVEDQMNEFLTMIMSSQKINSNYDNYFKYKYSEKEEKFLNKEIYRKFSSYMIKNHLVGEKDDDIQNFIREYDKIHMKIMSELKLNYQDIEVNAYYFNEDRRYLFSSNKYAHHLSIHTEKSLNLHFIINQLILANYRNFTYLINNKVPTNIYIYYEGFSCCLMDKKGMFQIYLHIFNADLFNSIDKEKLSIFYRYKKINFNLKYIKEINSLTLMSRSFKNKKLLHCNNFYFQTNSFLALYYEDTLIEMHLLDPKYY